MSDMRSRRTGQRDFAALQRRMDGAAGKLFTSPAWHLPVPRVLVDPRVTAWARAEASDRHAQPLIRVSPQVAAEPEDYLRGTLAREAGHIALAHQRASHAGWALAIGVPLWALAIACGVIGVHHSTTEQTNLWFGLALVPALIALRLIVIPSRRNELAADQWSASLIGAAAVVSTLQHLNEELSPLGRLAARSGMDTHRHRASEPGTFSSIRRRDPVDPRCRNAIGR